MGASGERVFGFGHRNPEGRTYPLIDSSGAPVASISPSFWRSRFEAADAEGNLLCIGKARLVTGWVSHTPSGGELLRLRVGMFGRHRTTLRGGELECQSIGKVLTKEWYFQAVDGRNLLQAIPNDAAGTWPPDVWVVRSDGTLTIAEVVSVVELHRLEYKRKRRRHPSSRPPRMTIRPIGRGFG